MTQHASAAFITGAPTKHSLFSESSYSQAMYSYLPLNCQLPVHLTVYWGLTLLNPKNLKCIKPEALNPKT